MKLGSKEMRALRRAADIAEAQRELMELLNGRPERKWASAGFLAASVVGLLLAGASASLIQISAEQIPIAQQQFVSADRGTTTR
jgi:hypothetical protein